MNVSRMFPDRLNLAKGGVLGKFKYRPPKIRMYAPKVDGSCTLYIQLLIHRKKDRIDLSVDVKPEDFDGRHVKGYVPGASDKNLIIDNAVARISDIYTEYRLSHRPITLEKVMYDYHHWDLRFDALKFIENKIKERNKSVELSTTEQHENLLKKLKKFRPTGITFADIDLKFLNDYNTWLKGLGNNDNTRRKEFDHFKTFINLAIDAGVRMDNPFKGFTLPPKSDRIVFLTEDELKELINYFYKPGIPDHHKRVLSGFLFMCFTGLRYSDAVRASYKMLFGDTLILIPKKSRKKGLTVNIPITAEARNFINGKEDKLLHYYRDWAANKYIKQVARAAGIKTHLTNHVGRHTFATLFLMRGGNVITLQSLLGHSDISDTMKYVHIVDKYRDEQMKNAWAGMVPQMEQHPEEDKPVSAMGEAFKKEYEAYLFSLDAVNNPAGWKPMFLKRHERKVIEFQVKHPTLFDDKKHIITDKLLLFKG